MLSPHRRRVTGSRTPSPLLLYIILSHSLLQPVNDHRQAATTPRRRTPPPTMASIHSTAILKRIAVDYTPDACHHSPDTDEIHVTFDHRGGARWRSPHRFCHGTFGAKIRCPDGDTSGLNYNIYLSSFETEDPNRTQDEIDFEFLGKDKTIVQTNYYANGVGGREVIHQLGFDCSEDYHEYLIRWEEGFIEWLIDGVLVRRDERKEGEAFPDKPMFLYASVWDASGIDEGRWTGRYLGSHAPYVCWYKDVKVPTETIVIEEEEEE